VESEFWSELGSLRLNSRLDVAFFNPEFPPGTRVTNLFTNTEFAQGAPGGPASDLKARSLASQAMAPVNANSKTTPPVAVAGWTGIDWVVASLGTLLALAAGLGIALLARQTRSSRNVRSVTHAGMGFRRYVR
jgi:hypothetical protein